MRKIKLENRDGLDLYMEEIEPCRWKMTGVPEWGTYNVSYDDSECKHIRFIDPTGGPLMGVGSVIDDEVVTGISWEKGVGFVFRTK